jgi:thiamine monophosphate synthase
MRNIQTRNFKADEDALAALLSKAKTEQRSDDALSVSIRLAALSIHVRQQEMSAAEIIELLDKEAERFENQAQEMH